MMYQIGALVYFWRGN